MKEEEDVLVLEVHNDLRLDPLCKKPDLLAGACNTSARDAESGESLGLLAKSWAELVTDR